MIQNLAWRGYSIVTIDEIFLLLLFTFNLFIIDNYILLTFTKETTSNL